MWRSYTGRGWAWLLGSAPAPAPRLGSNLLTWLEDARAQLDPAALRVEVEALPAPRSRLHHPEAMRRAEQLVTEEFSATGWAVQRRPLFLDRVQGWRDYGDFAPTTYEGLEGANLVAVKEGRVPSALVVLAHLDTVRDSPGANDNTASVVALLALARLLAPLDLHHTVLLAVVDFEELGLVGARALVPELLAERPLLGAINLETCSYTDPRPRSQQLPAGLGVLYPVQVARVREHGYAADFTALIHDRGASRLAGICAAALAHLAGPEAPVRLLAPADLPRIGPLLARTVPLVRQFARSDHVAFWEHGVPAAQITDTANFRDRAYHSPHDTSDRLDYQRLAHTILATAATVHAMCASPPAT